MSVILAGFVAGALSRVVDSGFFHGALQGMSVALLVVGAYTVGRGVWGSGRGGAGDDTSMWLPSKDRRE